MHASEPSRELLTIKEVALELRVHRVTVAKLLRRGELPGAFRVGTEWRIPRASLDALARVSA